VSDAGSGSEFSGYAGKFRCFLERRVLEQFVLIHLFQKRLLNRRAVSV
jgi:phage-related protein